MVPDVSESILMMLFFEEPTEPLRGWVKAFKPTTLQDAIWKNRDLEGTTSKNKFVPRPPLAPRGRDQRFIDKGKGKLDEATKRKLRRKQLCYTCKESWEPRHSCMGKGKIHYIEVPSDSEEEDDVGHLQNMEVAQAEEEAMCKQAGIKKVVIASISGVPKISTFGMRVVLQG
jgi:hypothetical protein